MFTIVNASPNGLALARSVVLLLNLNFSDFQICITYAYIYIHIYIFLSYLYVFFSDMPNLQHRGIWLGIKRHMQHQVGKNNGRNPVFTYLNFHFFCPSYLFIYFFPFLVQLGLVKNYSGFLFFHTGFVQQNKNLIILAS